MSENNYCPCCGRHCDLSDPHCGRGEEYARTGVIPERGNEHSHEHDHKHEHKHMPKSRRAANYNNLDSDNKLIMNLRDLGHMIRFLFEGKGSQKRILIILHETGSMTQRELTERLGIQPGSASEVIGKLEGAGLIRRTPSEEDRRTCEIQLTEFGREKAEEAVLQRKTRHQEMFSCLSDEEKDTLLKLLEKLNSDWDSRYYENAKRFGHHHHSHEKDNHSHRHGGHHGEFSV